MVLDVLIVGSGNSALCAAIAAKSAGSSVLVIEKAGEDLAGGNSKYTAGAMRFCYSGNEDLFPLLENPNDDRLLTAEFGAYTAEDFSRDLLSFNDGRPLSSEQQILVAESYNALSWLSGHGVKFEPIYERQSFSREGKRIFWGGLTLAARNEGVGLVESEMAAFACLGGDIKYNCEAVELIREGTAVCGVRVRSKSGMEDILAKSVVLACGGFEGNEDLRVRFLGPEWSSAKVRGTPHNTGAGLTMAYAADAQAYGYYPGCHATPMDLHMADFGNLSLPHDQRKNYRKICYFLGVMANIEGRRFVDEGENFRNYTYAQFGAAILKQPRHRAWQIFDSKVFDLLYEEYHFADAHYVEAETIEELVVRMEDSNQTQMLQMIREYNDAVDDSIAFNPAIKDGRGTKGLDIPKSNWAQKIDQAPFRAYPVTGGITFTYGGLKVGQSGEVLNKADLEIPGLYACGELVGGVFFNGYPGGAGLTSGAVFGRIAGSGASNYAARRG